jgi:preprotein translocase subunit SecA
MGGKTLNHRRPDSQQAAHVHGPACDHEPHAGHDHAHIHGPDCDHGPAIEPFVRSEPKINRNDPCPCGSGKKYKKCHDPNG